MRTLCIALLLTACGGTEGDGLGERHARHMAWSRLGIAEYHVTRGFQHGNSHEREVRIAVRDRAVASATYLDDGTAVDPASLAALRTIDGMFDLIDEAVDRDVYRVDITYDPTRNYPTYITIDDDSATADDEDSYTLSDLTTP